MKPDSIAARQEVWHDETLYPCTTAAHIAFEATGANMRLFAGYTDLVSGDPDQNSGADWMTYVQWLEGEIGITTDRDPHEYESADDMREHYKYVSELWEELAKIKPPHYNHMGVTQDEHERYCVQMRPQDEAFFRDNGHRPIRDFNWAELVTATARRQRINIARRITESESEPEASVQKFDAKGRTLVRVPGDVIAVVEVDDYGATAIDKVVFTPHASSAGYFGPHAEYWDFPEGVTQEQVEDHLRIQDVDGRFWRAMQEHLPTHDVKWEE